MLSLAWAALGIAAPEPPRQDTGELRSLALALGSPSWIERESAQERLLAAGLPAVPFLEEASRSENVELAHRAQHVLSLIDPPVLEFQVFKVELSSPGRVAEVLTALGTEDAREVSTASAASGAPPYVMVLQPAAGGRMSMDVRQGTGETGQANVRRIVSGPGVVSRINASEESLYHKSGLFLERQRRGYLNLIYFRRGRKSLLSSDPIPSSLPAAGEDLERRLLAQAASTEERARLEALDILAELRLPKARGLFQGLVGDPVLKPLACLALDRTECLQEIVAGESDVPGETDFLSEVRFAQDWQPSLEVRAALRLLELGKPGAVQRVLAQLVLRSDPFEQHVLKAALADLMLGSDLAADREAVLDAVFSEAVLVSAAWEDPETEYFYSTAISLLNPASEKDIERGQAFLERLRSYIRQGGLALVQSRARSFFELWCRAARKVPKETVLSRTSFLIEMLESAVEAAAFSDVMSLIEDALMARASEADSRSAQSPPLERGQLSDEELESLIGILEQKLLSADMGLASRSVQWILRLSQAFSLRPGQLRRIVQCLLETAEAPAWDVTAQAADPSLQAASGLKGFYFRQIEEQLVRWTGVPAPPRKSSIETSFDTAPWKTWARNDDLVSAREKKLLTSGEAQPDRAGLSALPPLVYYEFDILFKEERIPAGSVEPGFDVLDGRRLEVKPGERIRYRDRWGNDLSLFVEPTTPVGAGGLQRVRLGGKSFVFAGIPTLSTTTQGKEMSASWYEVSSPPFQSRALSRRQGTPSYRTVLFVAPLSEDQPPPSQGSRARELWQDFLERHLLSLPAEMPPQKLNSILSFIRTLNLKGCAPLLKRVFHANPTFELARSLCEEGDPDALAFLLKELNSNVLDRRINAAMALAQAGSAEGVRFLLGSLKADSTSLQKFQLQALHALDIYLASAPPKDPARIEALDFLLSRIHDPMLQYRIFNLLKREAGQDFGFAVATQAGDDEKRQAALKGATDAARAWWESAREAAAGRSRDTEKR